MEELFKQTRRRSLNLFRLQRTARPPPSHITNRPQAFPPTYHRLRKYHHHSTLQVKVSIQLRRLAGNALPAVASDETRPAKRPRKRKAKAPTQATETPVAGMSAMQSVFRASATGLPAQNNNKPGQVQWPPQIVPQVQQLPSYFPPSMTVSANGEYTMAPTQNNGALASQSRYPPSQQPSPTPASSSRVNP
jgi:hypothetical protein